MSGTVLNAIGRSIYQLGFEICPILFQGGIAQNMPGNVLPIMAITEAANFVDGLISGSQISLAQFFAHFRPLGGTQLVANQLGAYPFANQVVAGNAIIRQPLEISLEMACPAKNDLGYFIKLGIMTLLRRTLDSHNAQGGTYIVVTPSQIYEGCVLIDLTCGEDSDDKQPQSLWRWDFVQPLLTVQAATGVMNTMMSKINGQLPNSGALSGSNVTVGAPMGSAGAASIPAASNLTGVIATAPSLTGSAPVTGSSL